MVAMSRSKAKTEAVATTRQTRSSASSGGAPSSATVTTSPLKKKSKISVDVENCKPAVVINKAEPSGKKAVVKKETTSKGSKGREKGLTRKGKKANESDLVEEYCVCQGTDDGTPMIRCEGECQKWYHFRCVSLTEQEAEEIALYICPTCESKSGLRIIKDWEGPDAFEEITGNTADKAKADNTQVIYKEDVKETEESPEEDNDDGTEDEYVTEPEGKKHKTGRGRKVSPTPDKSASDSEDSDAAPSKRVVRRAGRTNVRRIKDSTSPAPSSTLAHKRRGSTVQPQSSKRSKASEYQSAQADPVRKYCLGKLDEVIQAIFTEYPLLKNERIVEDGESKNVANLTDEEKQEVQQNASAFVTELEECLYHTYSEADKSGNASVGAKYKERFRMLTFNLGKSDRDVLRRGIASGRITPSQISVMSSTDLANEQTKQEIQIAEKESLEHSILTKMSAPRAKITHKGFEDIEDLNGGSQREVDQRKEDDEERMDRERTARFRTVVQTHNLRSTHGEAASASPGLPDSPAVAHTPWGGPPALPTHVLQHQNEHGPPASPTTGRPPARPLFVPSVSDMITPAEGGLNLADLINIDDDSPPRDIPPPSPSAQGDKAPKLFESMSTNTPSPEITIPSGPSPFAPSKPLTSPRHTSFDLNSLWTGKTEGSPAEQLVERPSATEEVKESDIDMDNLGEDADDHDFDMFLDQDDKGLEASSAQTMEMERPTELSIEKLPRVWAGTISMPLDSLTPLVPPVVASQIGGRSLDDNSPLWRTLFSTTEARIDGRVAVDKSSLYLLNTRLNVQKELIAVCFTPPSESDSSKFNELVDYLVAKDRHALIFPWGHHPPPQAPGRELYIIPLLKEQPVPEYIEMLDDLRLPKARTGNVLLGVFVLNKGKLAPPAQISVEATTPGPPQPPVLGSAIPSSVYAPIPNVNSTPVNVTPSTLAAEVASLTPEQISLMLRHLGHTAPLLQPTPSSSHSPSLPPVPIPQFPVTGFQSPYHPSPLIPPHRSPPDSYGQTSYDNYERGDHQRRHSYSRDDRGGRGGRSRGTDRGRSHNRGRGRPYGADRPRRDSDGRMPDSGWASRGRGDGTSRSPPQGRTTRFGEPSSQWG